MALIRSLFNTRLYGILALVLFCAEPCVWAQQVVVLPDAPANATSAEEVRSIPQRHDLSYEDWRKPEVPAGMRPEIELLDRYDGPTFTRELLHVQWREFDPIDLIVVRPVTTKKTPVVVYLYSYPASNDRYKDAKFCEFLTRNGFAAVGFVSALTGQRLHDRPTKEWFVSQLPESLGTTVHDVQMVLNYLATRGDLDMNRVGMWGDGSGAAIAILAAGADPRIKALDLLDPWGDWSNWLAKSTLVPERERDTYLAPAFLGALEELEPTKVLPKLNIPMRIQHIDNLTVTPSLARQHIEANAPAQSRVVHYGNSKEFVDNVVAKGTSFLWIQQQFASSDAGELEAKPKSAKADELK